MKYAEVWQKIPEVLKLSGAESYPQPSSWLGHEADKYLKEIAYFAKTIPKALQPEWLQDWAVSYRSFYDSYQVLRSKDPMLFYQPRNKASAEFHASRAFVRYYRGGNRTSKTQSGYAEHYFTVTGYHPYREMPKFPASTLIVAGLSFKDYAPKVFEKKLIFGEDNNILSPIFPENGKWFYHYDSRKHLLQIACPECAEAGKAQSCPGHHTKVTISLASSENGIGVIEAFAVRLAHGDEHLPEPFYNAMQMRVADSPGGCLIFTGTPLHGPESWESVRLTQQAEKPAKYNLCNMSDPSSPPLVSLHWCTQMDGNIVSADRTNIYAQNMDEFEYEARILGKPAPFTDSPVFDRKILQEMRKGCYKPELGALTSPVELDKCTDKTIMSFSQSTSGDLRVWKKPVAGEQYIVAVDTAAGLSKKTNDPSCASVIKLSFDKNRLSFELVAQYHGWTPIHEYTDEVYKLGIWYNSAMVIVELTGGLGRAVLERLKKDLFYWNIFRDTNKGEYANFMQDVRFGIDTSAFSKPSMIAILQQVLMSGRLVCPCVDTIQEMSSYEQLRTDSGHTRYRGAGGTHDDRVMSLIIGVSTSISNGLFNADNVLEKADREHRDLTYSPEWKKIHEEISPYNLEGERWY